VIAGFEERHNRTALTVRLIDGWARDQGLWGPAPLPLGRTSYFLFAAVDAAGNEREFPHPTRLIVTRNASGYDLFFGHVCPPDKIRRRGWLPDGTYRLRVESDYYQRFEQQVDVSTPKGTQRLAVPHEWVLQPGYAYPFGESLPLGKAQVGPGPCTAATFPGARGITLLRGVERDAQGKGIADAKVEAVGLPNVSYQTGANGQWVLVFPRGQRTGPVTIRVLRADGSLLRELANVCVVRGREASV
jgi:hypothetical protein